MSGIEINIDNPEQLDALFNPKSIRQQSARIAEHCINGATNFRLDLDKLDQTADFVLALITERYPSLEVPYHSRWRHFEVGQQLELNQLKQTLAKLPALDIARLGFDLIIPSVLVDAGAGDQWRFTNAEGEAIGRSEGLGLASLHLFLSGGLSESNQLQTDARGLAQLNEATFAGYFQVSDQNPLTGVPGRVNLLNSLAQALINKPDIFPNGRPGDLVDLLIKEFGQTIPAPAVLQRVIESFGDIWPARLSLCGRNMGDTWHYPPFGNATDALVPFHKLSQWLSYSLIECLEMGGINVTQLNQLTGLAEYRNGGLMVDSGLLVLRDPTLAEQHWPVDSELVIEWRALTLWLLDKLAVKIQQQLNLDDSSFPLVKVLEGGTWAAGRAIALQTRGNLNPPLNIISDGTVF